MGIKLSGEGVHLTILGAWMVRKSESESVKEKGSTGLARIQVFGSAQVFKILVNGEYYEGCLVP